MRRLFRLPTTLAFPDSRIAAPLLLSPASFGWPTLSRVGARFALVAVPLLLSTAPARAATLYVDDDACPAPGAGTQLDPYCSIQAAINAAVDTDQILVAPGTYHEIIDFFGKAITVQSSGGAALTTIDATNVPDPGDGLPVVRCDNGEGLDTVLDGFTLMGGTGDKTLVEGKTFGGGMFNNGSSPTVMNCILRDNTIGRLVGGGMSNVFGSHPTVTNCTFMGNSASRGGGGMYNCYSNPIMTDCTFSENYSSIYGGGMNNEYSHPTVKNCTFTGNTAFGGGGIYNDSSTPIVKNCTFAENTASTGGGAVYDRSSNSDITDCRFYGNISSGGGGVFSFRSSPTVANCIFNGNIAERRGGMRNLFGIPAITNCTFNGNTAGEFGGGMYNSNDTYSTVTNCIFWGNSDSRGMGKSGQIFAADDGLVVNYSNIQGGWTGPGGLGNINADPLFVDADGPDNIVGTDDDELRLQSGSPSIDVGDNNVVTEPTDLDGNPRIINTTVDMGAYEFHGPVLFFDIKLGQCPNSVSRKSQGKLPAAILGTEEFDVSTVDLTTLQLFRVDGAGDPVALLEGPATESTVQDVATPFNGDLCDCHELQGDGLPDLLMKFSTADVVRTLLLYTLQKGTSLEIVLTGNLLDGMPFLARDCVTLTSPVDLDADWDDDGDVDGVDFAQFAQCFNKAGNPPRTLGCSAKAADNFDFDIDGDVDGADFSVFAACFNKAGNPPRTLGCPQN